MNNLLEVHKFRCINYRNIGVNVLTSLENNYPLLQWSHPFIHSLKVRSSLFPTPILSSFGDQLKGFTRMSRLQYRIYNLGEKTFFEIKDQKKFIVEIENNYLLMPFEMKIELSVQDSERNEFDYPCNLYVVPTDCSKGSWYDVAEGSIYICIFLKIFRMCMPISKYQSVDIYTFLNSKFYQARSSRARNDCVLLYGSKPQNLFYCSYFCTYHLF